MTGFAAQRLVELEVGEVTGAAEMAAELASTRTACVARATMTWPSA